MPAVEDIPLVARRATRAKTEVRRTLGLPDDPPVVLASFGGFGLPLPAATLAEERRLTTVVTDVEIPRPLAGSLGDALRQHTYQDLQARGLGYPDLVAAADVVVTKPGYGIVSECIANGTALLYASHGGFVEQTVLLEAMPRFLRTAPIAEDALRAGHWADAVEAVLAQPAPLERLAIDGAETAARRILEVADAR